MSHSWCLRCVKCDDRSGYINHGDSETSGWPAVVRVWPSIRPMWEASRKEGWPWTIDLNNLYISGYEGCGRSIWDWLFEHDTHGIEMVSEYGVEEYPSVLLLPPRAPRSFTF